MGNRKYMLCTLLAFCLFLNSICISAYASGSNAISIDEYLIDLGMPFEVVSSIAEGQKELIFETTYGEEARYISYEVHNYKMDDNGSLYSLSKSSSISSSDLTITVVGIEAVQQSGLSQNTEYKIYPTFVWNKMVKIKNDTFAMAMTSGWSAVPQLRNLRVHLMDTHGGISKAYSDIQPSDSSEYGYAFHIPSSTGFMNEWYEGHAYFTVEKVSSTARPRISIKYIHDTSLPMNTSYSVNIAPLSINISGSTSKLAIMADNYTISGI